MPFIWPSNDLLLSLGGTVLRVIIVLIAGVVARRLAGHLSDRLMTARFGALADNKRALTLAVLLRSVARYAIDAVVILTIIQLFGVNISSLLAAAGILGLAVGFGAQNLVRDLIGGFFIVFEDQFSVGEYITAAGMSGIVEEIGFRTIKVRDFGGELHVIPNGKVEQVTNFSRGNMRVLVRVEVAYEEDLSQVFGVIERACEELKNQHEEIAEGPRVLGVTELGPSGVTILVWALAQSMQQWAVERDLRLAIKQAFDREGIEIPYPRQVLVPARMTKIERQSSDQQ